MQLVTSILCACVLQTTIEIHIEIHNFQRKLHITFSTKLYHGWTDMTQQKLLFHV